MSEQTLAPTAIPLIPRGVRLHFDKVRDRWVLLAPERTIALDPPGLAILREIDGLRSLSDIAERLAVRYDAPVAQITDDCREFVIGLTDRRILEVRP